MSGRPAGNADQSWTVPNVICWLRIAGLLPLLWTAYHGYRATFVAIVVALLLSDWIDGKLAILMDQRTTFGARLDSVADALMYGALAPALWWLEPDLIREYAPWFVAAIATWALSVGVAVVKWGRMPSYHTRGAKASWFAVGGATVVALLYGITRPVPWALALVVLTNLEAVAIGCVLSAWRSNVPSLWHALRSRSVGRA